MRRLIKENENKKEKVADSIQTLLHIVEANKKSKFIESLELGDVYISDRYNTIECNIQVMGWCEDPDLLQFTNQLKEVDEEMDKVLLNYQFSSNGSFNKKKGQYNNLMWYLVGCEWSTEGDYILKMKYHFIQEEYDDE